MTQTARSRWGYRLSTLLILVAVLGLGLKLVNVHLTKLGDVRREEAVARANEAQAKAALARQRANLTPLGPAPLSITPPSNVPEQDKPGADE
jgi:hypothetical protein